MSAIQELEPYIAAYQGRIRQAKDDSKMTLEELATRSGVPVSAVRRLYAGTQTDPRLYNSAALCKTFGLSLDQMFGLNQPKGSPNDLIARNHQLEVENARLVATNEANNAQIKSVHSLCYLLVFICAMLMMSLISYLVLDSQIAYAGIISGGELSVAAWILVGLIIASVIASGITIFRIIRKERHHEEDESPRS